VNNHPLPPEQVRKRLRAILETGTLTYAIPHALERLRQRNISLVDCENVLRGGVVAPAEWENGAWRYPVRTQKITVIVQFLDEDELLVVTAWRNS
jgi:Domain of unknown function (DUF4258)